MRTRCEKRITPRIPVPRMDRIPGRGAWDTVNLPIRLHCDSNVLVDVECGEGWTCHNPVYMGVAYRMGSEHVRAFNVAKTDRPLANDRELLAWSVKLCEEIRKGRLATRPKQKLRGEHENQKQEAAVHC